MNEILRFIKVKRKELKLSQEELAFKSGVGLRFLRELEQGKTTLGLDKVNQVLRLFGKEVGIAVLADEHEEHEENEL